MADVVLGSGQGKYAPRALVQALAEVLRNEGFSVVIEHPFPGGWSMRRHARPDEGIFCIQIELARRLIKSADNPTTCSPEAVARLRSVMRDVAAAAQGALAT